MTQATIQAGQITTENVQRRALGNKGKQIATGSQGKLVTCYNCRGQEYTKNARRRNGKRTHNGSKIRHCLWKLKRKALFWMQRLKLFLVDVECTTPYVEPLAITTTTAFEVSHEDAYDSDVDEAPHAAAAFMANLTGTSTREGTSNDTDFHSEMEILLEPTSNKLLVGLDDGVAASFQRSRIHKPHAHTQAFKVNHSKAQVDQESQIKMIQVKEMMQDNDLKNSKSKDKGSRSRSQSMNDQSHYKQDKTKTRQSINVKSHIFNVIGSTEEFEERDLNIGGDC
ncbi:hypothetical protein Tco_0072129 [Tanacetum coccineum]